MAKSDQSNKDDNVIPLGDQNPEFERDKSATIIQRMHLAASDLSPLEKDGEVKLRGDSGYAYISHDAVTLAVRKVMLKHGIMPVPTVLECSNNANRTEVKISVSFVNVDDPKDTLETSSFGYGVDTSDKGPGKAYSYALKYAYLKAFMLNTGEDIEQYDIEHEPESARESQIEEAKEETRKALEVAANNLKNAINGAETEADLKLLRKENKAWLETIPGVTAAYFNAEFEKRETELKDK